MEGNLKAADSASILGSLSGLIGWLSDAIVPGRFIGELGTAGDEVGRAGEGSQVVEHVEAGGAGPGAEGAGPEEVWSVGKYCSWRFLLCLSSKKLILSVSMKHFSLYVESSLSRDVILALAVFNSRFRSSFSIASLDTGTSFLLCFLGGGRGACITVVREVGSTDTKEGVVDREAGG